jgi:prephenate dehydrogenase
MHNLMPHINRSTVELQRAFNDINGADNASTETTGRCKKDFEGWKGHCTEMTVEAHDVKFAVDIHLHNIYVAS